MPRIRIRWPAGDATATLNETPTVAKLMQALPYSNRANVWGDEVYFSLPFSAEAESTATAVVPTGSVCFWLDGNAIALLFGPTPVSQAGECRLISAANPMGMLDQDPDCLRSIRAGDCVTLERDE